MADSSYLDARRKSTKSLKTPRYEDGVVYIPLTRGQWAVVDQIDSHFARFNWHYSGNGYARRAVRVDGKQKIVSLHRLILNAPDDMEVDHLDGDRLNNRRNNLMIVSALENRQNVSAKKNSKTGVRGVVWVERLKRYKADCRVNGKRYFVGYYDDLDSARVAVQGKRVALGSHGPNRS